MILPIPDFWPVFKATNGALSCCESIAIVNLASQAPEGDFLELGVAEGKSAMSAALVMTTGVFYLVDPILSDDNISIDINSKIFRTAKRRLETVCYPGYSTEFLERTDKKYAYVFVDSGSHQDGLPFQEVKLLEDRMLQGGIIAFHDFKSQFIEVEGAYQYLLLTGKYEEVKIQWDDIVGFANSTDLEKDNKSWHHNELPFPCFVGALRRK